MAVEIGGKQYGTCSKCGLLHRMTQAGLLIRHGAQGKCPGSGHPPYRHMPVAERVSETASPASTAAVDAAE